MTQIKVFGKVQGVAFRYYTKLKADEIGIRGTVENLENGSVLIHCQGTKAENQLMIDWCKVGSPAADVEVVIFTEMNCKVEFQNFSILRGYRE